MLKPTPAVVRSSQSGNLVALPRPFRPRKTVLTLFGTRPEVIKLAPVIHQIERFENIRTINVTSGQHSELLYPFIDLFNLRVDTDLRLMQPDQDTWELCDRIIAALNLIVAADAPDLILVQGDTTTALAGALAAHHHNIPLGHVEAGLRSGNLRSPYPEEMNRRLISQLATHHFAATTRNRDALLNEGIPRNSIFVTGNPIVDALQAILSSGPRINGRDELAAITAGHKTIVLTTHRREYFGEVLAENLRVLLRFVEHHEDVALVFPVHPNPNVCEPAREILGSNPRVALIPPMPYREFLHLLAQSWLVISDSGGIQEEVPSLGKPLLILRGNTERPECINAGIARLVHGGPQMLAAMLEDAYRANSWIHRVRSVRNPFGNGDSGLRIAQCVSHLLEAQPLASLAI